MGLFSLVGSIIGGSKKKKAADAAGKLINDAAMKGVAESARQFDATRQDFAPYQEAGQAALERMTALLGMGTPESQASEIEALRETPLYKSLYNTGEEAVLADAISTIATGGFNPKTFLKAIM